MKLIRSNHKIYPLYFYKSISGDPLWWWVVSPYFATTFKTEEDAYLAAIRERLIDICVIDYDVEVHADRLGKNRL